MPSEVGTESQYLIIDEERDEELERVLCEEEAQRIGDQYDNDGYSVVVVEEDQLPEDDSFSLVQTDQGNLRLIERPDKTDRCLFLVGGQGEILDSSAMPRFHQLIVLFEKGQVLTFHSEGLGFTQYGWTGEEILEQHYSDAEWAVKDDLGSKEYEVI